jgi:hypothetical protein
MVTEKSGAAAQIVGSVEESFFQCAPGDLHRIFEVLRKTLYSNAILAVVREYSANAQDEHRSLGVKQPFIVHAPSSLEPYFSVRDFGNGLSDDGVRRIFAGYGASTKDTNPDDIGGFGIGSKSAFAYSDSYMVTSWHGGFKSPYTCYIDETQIGKVARLGEPLPSNEGNGIEVCVRLKNLEDLPAFREAIVEILARCDLHSVIVGNQETIDAVLADADSLIAAGEGWKLRHYSPKNSLRDNKQFVVKLNGMRYGAILESGRFSKIMPLPYVQELEVDLTHMGLKPIASRESVRIDETVIPYLETLRDPVFKDRCDRLIEKIKAAKTPWTKRVLETELSDYNLRKTVHSMFAFLVRPTALWGLDGRHDVSVFHVFRSEANPCVSPCDYVPCDFNSRLLVIHGLRLKEAAQMAKAYASGLKNERASFFLCLSPHKDKFERFLDDTGLRGIPVVDLTDDPRLRISKPSVSKQIHVFHPQGGPFWQPLVGEVPTQAVQIYATRAKGKFLPAKASFTPATLSKVIKLMTKLFDRVTLVAYADPIPGVPELGEFLLSQTQATYPDAIAWMRSEYVRSEVPRTIPYIVEADLPEGENSLRPLLAMVTVKNWELSENAKALRQLFVLTDLYPNLAPGLAQQIEEVLVRYPLLQHLSIDAPQGDTMRYIELQAEATTADSSIL